MSAPSLSAVAGLAAAGAELRGHGYTWETVRERTGLNWQLPFPLSRLDEIDTPRLADESRPPVDWLIKLLLLGDAIASERRDARRARPRRAAARVRRHGHERRARAALEGHAARVRLAVAGRGVAGDRARPVER